MTLVFRKNPSSTAAAGKEQVLDFDFKKHYPDVNRNMAWADIEPYIRQATRTYILPYLGETLYEDIAQKLSTGATLTSEQQTFADFLRDAVAYNTIMVALPKKNTVVASMGAVENVATEGTTGSTLWKFKTTLWSVAQDADRMVDEMLAWMEVRVEAGSTYFSDWKNDPAYDETTSAFFRQPRDLQKIHNIGKSLRTFRALVPMLDECAHRYILPILCQAQFDALAAAVKANTLTSDQKNLLLRVQRPLAKWAIYHAAQAQPILVENDGFRVVSNADAIDQRAYSTEVIRGAIEGLKEQTLFAARQAMGDLTNWLYSNPDKYPLWRDSDCNKVGTDGEVCVVAPGAGGVFI